MKIYAADWLPLRFVLGITIVCTSSFFACNTDFSNPDNSKAISEGIINYKITYPYYEKEGFMAQMMPETMVTKIKNNNFRNEISKAIFRTVFISDGNNKILKQQLYFWSKKIAVKLSEQETNDMLKEFPKFVLQKTDETDSIAGYLCHKAIATFEDSNNPPIDLYYTNEIKLNNPNWCNQFHEIDGMLLQYEIEQYGLKMRFTATDIHYEPIDDKEFEIEDGYKYVSSEVMQNEMEAIFSSLLE